MSVSTQSSLGNNLGESNGQWIPLMDYATKTGVSLSTLRRYIKSNKILYRVENGRYLLLDRSSTTEPKRAPEVDRIKAELQRAREEIAELKTLIAFYEERLPASRSNS